MQTTKQMQLHSMNQATRHRTDGYYSRKADSRQRFFVYVAAREALQTQMQQQGKRRKFYSSVSEGSVTDDCAC
ncbi:hypothetical protein KSZ_10200 [Dictyobacter formicarum]|uniref:Uncharacterized protein n=1 Tax=Dictyobacter formicarum TaxID=2778368 RepID=A0ABQ3VAZ5_9CHLR|nr:hypothetical protein KSZ_10200 [Dictyobacter formicarum]